MFDSKPNAITHMHYLSIVTSWLCIVITNAIYFLCLQQETTNKSCRVFNPQSESLCIAVAF